MRIFEIMQMPKTVDGNHESLYRSYQILQKVKEWLRADVPGHVILEVVYDMDKAEIVTESEQGEYEPRLYNDTRQTDTA